MDHEKITMTIPSEILPIVAKRKKDVPSKVFEYLILELYRLGELSSGKAAQYLQMERFEFVRFAARCGIPFFEMDKEELAQDYRQAHRGAGRTRK
ncbi:MAG: UPF0175 family protein [Thermodesulfobacteriota bacterium]